MGSKLEANWNPLSVKICQLARNGSLEAMDGSALPISSTYWLFWPIPSKTGKLTK
jgi:hypothetical protein